MMKARPAGKARTKPAPNLSTSSKKRKASDPLLQHLNWENVELEQLNPLFGRQYVFGKNVMLARVFLGKGCIVPLHGHHNEQLSYVLEGKLVFWIDDKPITVQGGEVLLIPPDMPHKIEALEDSLSLDIFDPPREDWINKTDSYLRQAK